MTCFAEHFLTSEKTQDKPFLLPISGECPGCGQTLLWGDVVRQRRYSLVETDVDVDEDYDEMSSQISNDDDFDDKEEFQ